MSTSIDHDNLYMHNKIFRETTKNLYKERHSKTLKINQNGFSKSSSDRQTRKRKKKKEKTEETNRKQKMADLNLNISIIILNINGLNIPIKRQRLAELI